MITIRDWLGNEANVYAKDLNEALRCARVLFPHIRDLLSEDGVPTSLILVFVNGIEYSVLERKVLRDGDVIELIPVLHRG